MAALIDSDMEERSCNVCDQPYRTGLKHCSCVCFLIENDVERNDTVALARSLLSEIQDFKQVLQDLRVTISSPLQQRVDITTKRVDYIVQHLFSPTGRLVCVEQPATLDSSCDDLCSPEDLSDAGKEVEECLPTVVICESTEEFESEDFITDVEQVETEVKTLKRKCPPAPQKPTRLAPSIFYSVKRLKK